MKEKDVIPGVLSWDKVITKCNWDSKKCLQLVSEIMEIIDERETKKNNKEKQKKSQKRKRTRETEAIVKGWELNGFVVHLSFLQLISEASLIFKSNLDLALSRILKQRELYESKHAAVDSRCLKIWDLLPFLISYSILALKWQHFRQYT